MRMNYLSANVTQKPQSSCKNMNLNSVEEMPTSDDDDDDDDDDSNVY